MWPSGASSAGGASGIKDAGPDLAVLVFDRPVSWAGAFTANRAAAAPVLWCRQQLGSPVRALVANSGNANACTGNTGASAVETTAAKTAALLGCSPEEVLVASTGPIGVPLPVELITAGLPDLISRTGSQVESFAEAIMTTDTCIKSCTVTAGEASVVGVAKGAAMIAPNMATMLGFIVTDAIVDDALLQETLSVAVQRTFNRISVDACESTNDSVFLFSTARRTVDGDALAAAVQEVCADLAEKIVRDAEGGTKLMRIHVAGAADEEFAVSLGKAVAASDLWRAAAAGADPNWGRILAALGSVPGAPSLAEIEISIGPEVVFAGGEPVGSVDVAAKAMSQDDFSLFCRVGEGPGEAVVLAADLTPEYVVLNSEITT
jgi:glutamate N-acetyltransferase/amino-acid N-acetyltransferase